MPGGGLSLPTFRRATGFIVSVLIALSVSNPSAHAQDIQPPLNDRSCTSQWTCPSATLPESHAFWDRENILLFSGIAASRALDYASTRNMLARGREEILLPDDVVHSTAGFPALEAAGAATSIAISYLLHRTGHHRLERWLSIGHIGVTTFGAVRNYSLESRQR